MAFLLPARLPTSRHRRLQTCPPSRSPLVAAPRMTQASVHSLATAVPLDKSALPSTPIPSSDAALSRFADFFSVMTGSWNSERTYHYVHDAAREDSQTTFDVVRLTPAQISQVLASNAAATAALSPSQRAATYGFNVSFLTKMASQDELVRSGTNLAFVPESIHQPGLIRGAYYRDLGYEESAPIKATFVFDCPRMELTMTTFYTKVVSVDQISLINPELRLRRIVNYRRPEDNVPVSDALLVGYGVEKKGSTRLVS